MKKKLSIFFLAIFLIFIQKTSANTDKPSSYVLGCNTDDNQNYLKNIDQVKIKKIEIDVNNYRRWTVNSIRIITNESRWIDERYKRRFNSKIRVIYENDDIADTHQFMSFENGSEAVICAWSIKDGKIIRCETGATPIPSQQRTIIFFF